MAAEALGSMFEGYVAQAGPALPEFLDVLGPLDIVVIDPGALAELGAAVPNANSSRTSSGAAVPARPRHPRHLPVARPRFAARLYDGWTIEEDGAPPAPRPRRRAPDGLVLVEARVSPGHDEPAARRVQLTRSRSAPFS